jgi:hypothetical protein
MHRFKHVGSKAFDFRRDFFDSRAFLPESGVAVFNNV